MLCSLINSCVIFVNHVPLKCCYYQTDLDIRKLVLFYDWNISASLSRNLSRRYQRPSNTFTRQYHPTDNPPKLKSMHRYMLISSLIISQR